MIALHKNKGKSVAACLKSRTDYAQNPDKTQQGELVSSYECSPLTVDEEFMLSKRQYELIYRCYSHPSLIFKMDFDSTILHVEIHCVLIRSIQARFQHTRTIFDPSLYRVILIPAYNISLDLSVLHRAIVLRGSWMFEHYGAVFNF